MSRVRGSAARGSCDGPVGNRRKFVPLLFLFLLALSWAAVSCKKTSPEHVIPAEIHAITKELADAAQSAAPTGTRVRIEMQASQKNPEAADGLEITLPKTGADSAARSQVTKIQRALGKVATNYGLTEEPSESREGILFFYLRGGTRTHAVHIHIGAGAPEQSGAKLAIILDDLGSDPRAAEAIFELPYPLTVSVLPDHEHSGEIAQEAQRRGYQVMLHLPMQAIGNEKAEARELRPGMPEAQVSRLVDEFLRNVPGAVGVNNHQGSEATSDSTLMSELMPVLRDRHLFYIDSRTTAATVAYDSARNSRLPSAFRNVPFLDDVAEVGAVEKQLELAFRGAREKGEAVAIGHPHPATLQALREVLPKAQSEGVRLTFASELVH